MEKNVYEKLFDELLQQFDVELIKYGKNAYRVFSDNCVVDDQTVCQTVTDIFDKLECYIDDSLVGDLDREAIDYGLKDFVPHPWDDALACIAKYNCGTKQEQKYVKDHKWEIEVLDMLCHHLDDIDINNLESVQTNSQVFYVEVSEVHKKLIRVIAADPDDACDIAQELLYTGDIECDEYKEDSTEIELQDKCDVEDFYLDVSDIPLYNEQGEEE